ncbi:YciI family protein [Agromyces sp. SYSU T00194]|uniref:YciI family protein n=1 Tax=Agromyces chitinivorans TaxID=3158560 RepID=UPI003390E088
MRFIGMLRHDEGAEVTPATYARMAEFAQEGRLNGTLVELGGLQPSAEGALVSLAGGRITAVDGPFTEAKELVGGYAIFDVRSRVEAVELGRRLMQIHLDTVPGWEGAVELRALQE